MSLEKGEAQNRGRWQWQWPHPSPTCPSWPSLDEKRSHLVDGCELLMLKTGVSPPSFLGISELPQSRGDMRLSIPMVGLDDKICQTISTGSGQCRTVVGRKPMLLCVIGIFSSETHWKHVAKAEG
jgi:hypothetical protein